MSVRTTADDKISEAKEKLNEAKELLTEAMKEDTWGFSDFKDAYVDDVYEVIINIMQSRRKL